jgi:hypothetical protein|tara:strand:+ start:965 stop:1102 length:138 start_codon:yes stop_codon:yes gene_type:complete
MPKTNISYLKEEKKKKKGVHSKNKHSKSKASKFYKKKYRGQGKKR